jgi:hypothetical protein
MSSDELRREDVLRIGGTDVPVVDCWLQQVDLKFYPENPRIYSIVCIGDEEPSQAEIEERLKEREHVKRLYQSIKANGGLTDPLIVRGGKNIVLEGNSRLAAYRLLAAQNPIAWGKVRCRVLPADIDESLVFKLLGQYHIVGRQDWQPFEQAGYLYRRHTKHGIPPEDMAREMGLPLGDVSSLLKTYSFMAEHGDADPQRWSYYDEYLRIRSINRRRREFPKMDAVVVGKIKSGEIPRAIDVRDKLGAIASVQGPAGRKLFAKFLQQDDSLDECYESALARGAKTVLVKRLNRFRTYVADPDRETDLAALPEAQLRKCRYELRKIGQSAQSLEATVGRLLDS